MGPETARIQELHVRPVGLQPTPGPTPFLSNREDRTLVSAVEAVTEILAVPASNRIGKDFDHRVACGQSKEPTHWFE